MRRPLEQHEREVRDFAAAIVARPVSDVEAECMERMARAGVSARAIAETILGRDVTQAEIDRARDLVSL